MEQSETASQPEAQTQDANHTSAPIPSTKYPSDSMLVPQHNPNMQVLPQATEIKLPPFIYAIGRVQPRFPSVSVQKEYWQALGRVPPGNQTEGQILYEALSQTENRYLIRQLCWVFIIGGMDAYLLQPRDSADLDLLVSSIKPDRRQEDIDIVIGIQGPIAPPEMCNGLMVPIVAFDQLYSFSYDEFIQAVPSGTTSKKQESQFREVVREVFNRIRQRADNFGATYEDRALNYLAVRYPNIYTRTAESYLQNESLTGIQVRSSTLSSTRMIVDVIFSYANRQTSFVDMYSAAVDVTEEFPFLVRALSPWFDR